MNLVVPIVVTGTDTSVGKTFVACGLAKSWSRQGLRVGVCKPLETGWPAKSVATTDADQLRIAAGSAQCIEDVCLYRFRDPVAPLVAAATENVAIDIHRIERHVSELCARHHVVLVEGAGGLLAPLAPNWTILDLAVSLRARVLVVVANRLGCLNHALLTDRTLRSHGARRLGFVMNQPPGTTDVSQLSNEKTLGDWTDVPVWRSPMEHDSSAWGRIAEAILTGIGE